jgi:hypothetical protein
MGSLKKPFHPTPGISIFGVDRGASQLDRPVTFNNDTRTLHINRYNIRFYLLAQQAETTTGSFRGFLHHVIHDLCMCDLPTKPCRNGSVVVT